MKLSDLRALIVLIASVTPDAADAQVVFDRSGDSIVSINGLRGKNFLPRSWDHLIKRTAPFFVRWTHDGVKHETIPSVEALH